ncbi:long-chain fatty acid--CoA ligase [Campylobacter volucris]|uniref:Long-chain fatty acid--CoA ligase n=2 Tax=Campylobacter volucris TaxID=1031542 RepID=A0AAE5YGY0_9BACT|nr:fatty acid--CoA ligase family protein [Campylobacter volucris]AJC93601.1 acyl-CoA synthetase (AMP-forming)/AMP-acid ligase II [Campylobacter volucris LMG 24379]AJC94596.1 acyl-CoA synthetase (AMP-forming)/AMP-acid ligase II [Campylobacter volucris LMG 24379]QBL13056.1 long-chain fatty acid--CoA ligase [Campylobacter volucris]QBL14008.1 long-chain fatty acid--CoA ligase [Campylobacter volucris]QEL07814.1 acyl-CoA synthetase (AMP-forming) / AMP-acid ligase II [Campylobacter volucris]
MHNFKNIFLRKIFSNKDNNALIYENIIYTYSQLSENVLKNINLLNSTTANIIGIIGDYDFESISLLLACIELNKIIIPFVDKKEIENKLKEVRCDLVFNNGEIILKNDDSINHPLVDRLIKENKPGLILFSSGSTGKPKAIIHDLDKITSSYLNKKTKNINILLFLMFDHIGGLNTLFNCLSMNACGVAIKDRKNVEYLAENIEKYKISLLPASPSLLSLMLAFNVMNNYDFSSLRLITYGTEKMPETLLDKLKQEFPKVKFHQTFGTSEVGITQTKSYKDFIKLENVEYKIIEGELYLKSNTQSLGYLNADNSVFTDDGYFASGDLVEVINENGEEYIKIVGRNKEIINVGGEKVLPQEVEGIIFQIPFIQDCLVYGQSNPLTGQSVCLKVVLTKEKNINSLELKKEIRLFCKDKLASYKIPTKVDIVESLEVSERFKKVRK